MSVSFSALIQTFVTEWSQKFLPFYFHVTFNLKVKDITTELLTFSLSSVKMKDNNTWIKLWRSEMFVIIESLKEISKYHPNPNQPQKAFFVRLLACALAFYVCLIVCLLVSLFWLLLFWQYRLRLSSLDNACAESNLHEFKHTSIKKKYITCHQNQSRASWVNYRKSFAMSSCMERAEINDPMAGAFRVK